MPLANNEPKFITECLSQVDGNSSLNMWYDPLTIFSAISSSQTCESQWMALKAVYLDPETEAGDISEYLGASYLASLAQNLDKQMRYDYDSCINKDVVDEANMWATDFVTSHAMFQLWSNDQRMMAAADAGTAIDAECSQACPNDGTCTGLCDGCLIGLSSFYQGYSTYLNQVYSQVEEDFWRRMEATLEQVTL